MTAAIRAVVFDFDGLMVNTEEIFNLTGRELMRRRNKVMTQECLHRMMGLRPHEAFAVMIEAFELTESIESLMAESQEIFNGHLDGRLSPMPGLFELLEQIESRRLPKGVATSSPRNYLDGMLRRFDLHERFDVTLTAEDVTHGKPHPEIYQKAAGRIGIATAEMLVLEDSEAGTRSAIAAGAVVVSIPQKHARHQAFQDAHTIASRLDDPLVLRLLGE